MNQQSQVWRGLSSHIHSQHLTPLVFDIYRAILVDTSSQPP